MSQSEPQSTLAVGVPQEEEDSEEDIDEQQASLFNKPGQDSKRHSETRSFDDSKEEEPDSSDNETESLEDFGIEEDHRPNNSRLDNPDGNLEADRRTNRRREAPETSQEQLFPDVDDENQLTLGGDKAYNQCKFG